MKNFIEKLNKLFETDFAITNSKGITIYNDEALEVVDLCNEYLITTSGFPAYLNIEVLRKCGYDVYPGETDIFGWLTGVIYKNGKELVFG